jgi:hypothetical protein
MINPMKNIYPFQKSPRCEATSKRTHKPCRAPAVKGWTVCRFHGARGGAPKGERNGKYRHGFYCQSAIAERQTVRNLIRTTCSLCAQRAKE